MRKHFDLKILQAGGLEGVPVEPVRHVDVLSGCGGVRPPRLRLLSAGSAPTQQGSRYTRYTPCPEEIGQLKGRIVTHQSLQLDLITTH